MGRHMNFRNNEEKYTCFKKLYDGWTVKAVMSKLDITRYRYQQFFNRAIEEHKKERERPIDFNIYAKIPFSENEEDYGTKFIQIRQMNTVVTQERIPTDLEVAVKTYKNMMAHERNVQHTDKGKSHPQSVISNVGNDGERNNSASQRLIRA